LIEAIVVNAKVDLLGSEWLGRTIDKEFVRDLRRLNPTIDPCGEDGEFHTCVVFAMALCSKTG
jgi:diphthine-ammonia ligase